MTYVNSNEIGIAAVEQAPLWTKPHTLRLSH